MVVFMPKQKEENRKKKKSSSVPGQYLGFSLQPTRFLARLLEAEPGTVISLEVFDDIGEESRNRVVAGQVKSVHDTNPISNRSIDLWKAFSNWLHAIEDGTLKIENTFFEIYVSKKRNGPLAQSFANANDFNIAHAALQNAKNELWGMAPAFPKRSTVSVELASFLEHVFSANEEIISQIIERFSLQFGSGSPQKDLSIQFLTKFIPNEHIPDVVRWAQGWVKQKTDLLIESGQPAFILYDDFHKEMVSLIRKLDMRSILCNLANNPTQEEIDLDLRTRTYVQQIDLIGLDYDEKIVAVNDFLRAASARTVWSEKCLVHSTSFDDLESSLTRKWRNSKTTIGILKQFRNDEEFGQLLFTDCGQHKEHLEGMEVPDYFIPGSFHSLADAEILGWHPNYSDELRKRKIAGGNK